MITNIIKNKLFFLPKVRQLIILKFNPKAISCSQLQFNLYTNFINAKFLFTNPAKLAGFYFYALINLNQIVISTPKTEFQHI